MSLRPISNRFLASLSVADLLVGLGIIPLWIFVIYWSPVSTVVNPFCKVLWVHTTAATTSNIRCVSIDRFIAIQFAFRYQDLVTRKRCYPTIILVWLFSLIIAFSLLPVDHRRLFDKDRKILLLQCCRFV